MDCINIHHPAKETDMLFNSFEFLLFFPLVVTVYFLLPFKARKFFLLAASLYFYMSFIPKYIMILGFTTVVDYSAAFFIDKFKDRKNLKKAVFITGVLLNVGLLVTFKYLGVIGDTINFFGKMISLKTVVLPELILPIGISFHTFQSMGYLIDVYKGTVPAEKNFFNFALFLMFFPQLVAGPIERTANLMGQLKEKHYLKAENVSFGGRMMLYGMFKKIVVADSLAIVADRVFNNVGKFGGWGLVFGVLCFTIQIYCDFSGYSDIAIGCAKIMDINLMKNFDTPYFSASVPEFWRRWHISLSTWFKDYVYIPLGGNRVSKPRWVFNQLVTFTVSGVWHGAGYTYVVWGFLNGVYIVVSRFVKPVKEKIAKILHVGNKPYITKPFSVLITFVLISFSWIFFRANTFSDAFYIIKNIFGPSFVDFGDISAFRIGVCVGAVILLMTIEGIMSYGKRAVSLFNRAPHFTRVICYGIMVAIILIFGSFGENQFIYFQF